MPIITDIQPSSMTDEHEADVQYTLIGGPLHGVTICLAADLTHNQSQVRITIEGVQFAYIGDTIGESLDHIEDATHLGHAWRPVRWIQRGGKVHIFSDDRPVMPAEVAQ